MQDMFILTLRHNIEQRLQKQHSIRQELRQHFSDHNEALYTEMKPQLGNQTRGDPALPREMPMDTHIGGLEGLEDRQNQVQQTERSLDLSQPSLDGELMFRESDRSNHGSLENPGGAVVSQISNCLSFSLEDSHSGEAGPGASGPLEETSGRQDGGNTREGA